MTEVEWSPSALHARSVFFEDLNDIDIYVEDTSATTIRIFTKLFQRSTSQFRIETVFGLGGRSEVIKRFESDKNSVRKRLYVIDGDFSCIVGETRRHEVPRGIFRLYRYCIENYLVDREAFGEVAHDEDGERRPAELLDDADFDNWMQGVSSQLLRLSLAYVCNEIFELGLKTSSRNIDEFYSDGEGILSDEKIDAVVDEIRGAADEKWGQGAFDAKLAELSARARKMHLAHLVVPPGKRYGLPLMVRRLKWLTKSKTSDKSITSRLCRYANIEEMAAAFDFIIN